jgi:putative NADPH-quinone reductase
MAKPVVVIQGHPDPAGGHLCHALADAYATGAASGGQTVDRVEVAQLDFPLLRSATEFESGATPPDIKAAQDKIMRADHMVLVYPLWLGTMPALFKAFLEQCFRPGFALDTDGNWDLVLRRPQPEEPRTQYPGVRRHYADPRVPVRQRRGGQ